MSIIHSWDDPEHEIIEIPFPEEKFDRYLKALGVNSANDLTFQQKRKIFITAIYDFKSGFLALDELAEIGGFLWSTLKGMETATTDLASVLYDASEMNFHIRQVKDEASGTRFDILLIKVTNYYEKHKALRITEG